jgi:hypothetical protein
MKSVILFLVFFISILMAANALKAEERGEFQPDTYYSPKPGMQKRCTPCTNNLTSCKYAAWYGRFEPEGKTVKVCNEFNECEQVKVPNGGKWYEYFRWTHREHVCY